MSQSGKIYRCGSLDGTNFTGALAQNAGVMADLTLPSSIGGGDRATCRLKSLVIVSTDNLAWEIQIFGSHDGPSADPNQDTFLGLWQFTAAMAAAGANNNFYYYGDGLDLPYEDIDLDQHLGAAKNIPQLHVRLVNRSAGAKGTYGSGSHFRVVFNLEPTLGGW